MILDLTLTNKNNYKKSILITEFGGGFLAKIDFHKLPILNMLTIQLGGWEKPKIQRIKFTNWTIFNVSIGFASIAGSYDH